ncbi:MAG: glycosyltransferase family 39 protein [Spirochaetales bacterium]|nr:glycosyltransferase family 39 protein [Spirochaetales bacterium]
MRRAALPVCIWILLMCQVFISFATENLIKNPSFEIDHNGWAAYWHTRSYWEGENDVSYTLETNGARTGNRYIKVSTNRENDVRVYQYVKVKPMTVYKLSVWIKAEDIPSGGIGANISIPDSYSYSRDIKETHGKWEQSVVYGMTGRYQTRMPVTLRIGSWAGFNSGTALFDDVRVEEVTMRPAGKKIDSFTFSEDINDEKIQKYFARVNNIRYKSKNLSISILYAILLLSSSILFTLYLFFVRGKRKTLDAIIKFSGEKLYYIFIAILFIVFYIVYIQNFWEITVYDVQLSFLIIMVMAAGVAAYLFRNNQLTPANLAKILIILGIAIRICYFLYTDPGTRQHDIWGAWNHIDYIRHIAKNFTLPAVGTYETYHPPVHYILSAIPYNIVRLFGMQEDYSMRAVELLMVFFSALTLIFIYKIFNKCRINKHALLIGVALACFHPNIIYMSVYLNNDATVFLFYIVSFYYLIKWVDDKSLKNVILLAVFTAISMLTKKSSIVLFPVLGIVFIVEFAKHRHEWKKYVKQGLIFLVIALPLGFSYIIRNYFLFHQDLSYAVPPLGTIMPNNPFNLFYVSIEELLKKPFVAPAPHENTFFLKMLIQTSLFSVFEFPGLEDIAVIMVACYLVLIVLIILNFILFKKEHMKDKGYIFLVNFVSTLVIYFRMRLYSPYDCTQAFRYVAPFIMISLCYFTGRSMARFSSTKYPVLNTIIKGQFWLFCLFTAFFILLIGPPV